MTRDKQDNPKVGFAGGLLKMAPWTLSAAVHIAIACVLTFIYMLTISPEAEEIIAPEVRLSVTAPAQAASDPAAAPIQNSPKAKARQPVDLSQLSLPQDNSAQTETIDLFDGSDEDLELWGDQTLEASAESQTRFFDATGQAMNIVYIADWSGSLISGGTYDTVLAELRRSISSLSPNQYFHVILFSSGKPTEASSRRLVPASDRAKLDAWQLILNNQPSSRTEPVAAIKRAFDVIKNSSPRREGKLIYLLTDGFLDINELRSTLAKLNSKKQVSVNIILHQDQRKSVRDSLADIAAENSGMFAWIEPN